MLKSEKLWPVYGGPSKTPKAKLGRLEEQLWGVNRRLGGHVTKGKHEKLAFEKAHLSSLIIELRLELGLDPAPVPRHSPHGERVHRVTLPNPELAFSCAA